MIEFGEKYTVKEDLTWQMIKGETVLIIDSKPSDVYKNVRYYIGEIVSDNGFKGNKYHFLEDELEPIPGEGDIVFEVVVYLDGTLRSVHYLYSDDELDEFNSAALVKLMGIDDIEILVKRV